jgi:hypothetical protein
MAEPREQPEELHRIVGIRTDGTYGVLRGGLTRREASEWFLRHFARLSVTTFCTLLREFSAL